MPSNFNAIYKLLKIIEKGYEYPLFPFENIDAKKIGVSQTKLENIMITLQKSGYIEGLEVVEFLGGRTVSGSNIRPTIEGLEFLEENSIMKKVAETIGDITHLLP